MKRIAKTNKVEKKGINKRRAGNSSFRSINNYQFDKMPNDNLYKNDNIYSIDKNFEFPQNEEKTFRLFYHYHFQKDIIKIIITLLYMRLLSSRMNSIFDIFYIFELIYFKNIIHIISFIISFIFTNEIFLKQDKFNFYMYYIFSFNQCIHIYSVYYNLKPFNEKYVGVSSEITFNLLLILFLNKKVTNCFFPIFIIICTYLLSSKSFLG